MAAASFASRRGSRRGLLMGSQAAELQRKLGLHVGDRGFVESTRPETFVVKEEHHRSPAADVVVDLSRFDGIKHRPERTVLVLLGDHGPTRAVGPPRRCIDMCIGLREACQINAMRALLHAHTSQEQPLR